MFVVVVVVVVVLLSSSSFPIGGLGITEPIQLKLWLNTLPYTGFKVCDGEVDSSSRWPAVPRKRSGNPDFRRFPPMLNWWADISLSFTQKNRYVQRANLGCVESKWANYSYIWTVAFSGWIPRCCFKWLNLMNPAVLKFTVEGSLGTAVNSVMLLQIIRSLETSWAEFTFQVPLITVN